MLANKLCGPQNGWNKDAAVRLLSMCIQELLTV